MKRWIAWILALSLILCAAVLPAAAEETGAETDAVSTASVIANGRNGQQNGPGGQMPGRQDQNGQMPGRQNRNGQMPGAQAPNSQMPGGQMPNGQAPNGRMPGGQPQGGWQQPGTIPAGTPDGTTPPETATGTDGTVTAPQENPDSIQPADNSASQAAPDAGQFRQKNRGRGGRNGKTMIAAGRQAVSLELLLEKGIISQEVYDAIISFINEYTAGMTGTPDAQAAPEAPEAPAMPDAPEAPAMPDAPEAPAAPEIPEAPAEAGEGSDT